MMWYSIHVVFESWVGGDSGSDPLCEDRVVLFRALDEANARKAAARYGKAGQSKYRNDADQLIEWKFARAEDIQEVGPEPEADGWEVASRYFRPSDIRKQQASEDDLP